MSTLVRRTFDRVVNWAVLLGFTGAWAVDHGYPTIGWSILGVALVLTLYDIFVRESHA